MLKFLSKLFGSKCEKDMKGVQPLDNKVKEEYEKLSGMKNDELRAKTSEFKQRIADYLKEIDDEINEIKLEADGTEDMELKAAHYDSIDKLTKDRDNKLEEILLEILPEAFAVVKDTARRF